MTSWTSALIDATSLSQADSSCSSRIFVSLILLNREEISSSLFSIPSSERFAELNFSSLTKMSELFCDSMWGGSSGIGGIAFSSISLETGGSSLGGDHSSISIVLKFLL